MRRARPCGGRLPAAGGRLGSLGAGAPGGRAGGRRAASGRAAPLLTAGRCGGSEGRQAPRGAGWGVRGWGRGAGRLRAPRTSPPEPGLWGRSAAPPLARRLVGKLRAALSARKRSAQRAQGHRSKVAGGGGTRTRAAVLLTSGGNRARPGSRGAPRGCVGAGRPPRRRACGSLLGTTGAALEGLPGAEDGGRTSWTHP